MIATILIENTFCLLLELKILRACTFISYAYCYLKGLRP